MRNLLADLDPINNPALPNLAGKAQKDTPALLGSFISGIVGVLLFFGTIMAFAQLLQGGIQWITSGGDKTQLDGARDRITNSLIGLILLFAAWSLFLVLLRFLGLSIVGENGSINIDLPSLIPKGS